MGLGIPWPLPDTLGHAAPLEAGDQEVQSLQVQLTMSSTHPKLWPDPPLHQKPGLSRPHCPCPEAHPSQARAQNEPPESLAGRGQRPGFPPLYLPSLTGHVLGAHQGQLVTRGSVWAKA